MRCLALLVIAGCTVGAGEPPVIVKPKPDPDRMPAAVLEKQDPAADTSHNRELSRSKVFYSNPNDTPLEGCARHAFQCGAGDASDGALVVLAALAAIAPRRRRLHRS
jgi:MYXO-CTERM domain-containing protein